MKICTEKHKNKRKAISVQGQGPSLPLESNEVSSKYICYFNIAGNMNDTSEIYLVAFIANNNNFILKNNQWMEEFNNHTKLMFPKSKIIYDFGSHFMVCTCVVMSCSLVFVFVFVLFVA